MFAPVSRYVGLSRKRRKQTPARAVRADWGRFRNIINEWYAKDTSKKVRAVFRNKGMSGQRLGGTAPYGYVKGENGQLLIDEETAPVVKLIFQLCVEGHGTGKIARMLKEREIPTPGTINFQRTGRTSRYHPMPPVYGVRKPCQGF